MKTFLILAYDANYGPDNGIYDWDIIHCEDEKEVQGIGYQMSEQVIESYSFITDSIDEEVRERLNEEGITYDHLDYEELYDDWYEDVLNEHIQYEYWELDPSIKYHEIINQNTDWEEIKNTYSVKGE